MACKHHGLISSGTDRACRALGRVSAADVCHPVEGLLPLVMRTMVHLAALIAAITGPQLSALLYDATLMQELLLWAPGDALHAVADAPDSGTCRRPRLTICCEMPVTSCGG